MYPLPLLPSFLPPSLLVPRPPRAERAAPPSKRPTQRSLPTRRHPAPSRTCRRACPQGRAGGRATARASASAFDPAGSEQEGRVSETREREEGGGGGRTSLKPNSSRAVWGGGHQGEGGLVWARQAGMRSEGGEGRGRTVVEDPAPERWTSRRASKRGGQREALASGGWELWTSGGRGREGRTDLDLPARQREGEGEVSSTARRHAPSAQPSPGRQPARRKARKGRTALPAQSAPRLGLAYFTVGGRRGRGCQLVERPAGGCEMGPGG